MATATMEDVRIPVEPRRQMKLRRKRAACSGEGAAAARSPGRERLAKSQVHGAQGTTDALVERGNSCIVGGRGRQREAVPEADAHAAIPSRVAGDRGVGGHDSYSQCGDRS